MHKDDKNMINLAFAFSDTKNLYPLFVATTLMSILARTKANLSIHILHDQSLSNFGKQILQLVAKEHEITFHQVPDLPANLAQKIPEAFGVGSFFRYYLADLPGTQHLKRIIYLDCDICALLDIAELWQIANYAFDMENYRLPFLACVKDQVAKINPDYFRKFNFDCANYANSGVLVFDLERIRKRMPNLMKIMIDALEILPHPSLFPDQDALNVILQKVSFVWLNDRFNFQTHILERWNLTAKELDNKLIHYCARKPWCVPSYTAAAPWLEYYQQVKELILVNGYDE